MPIGRAKILAAALDFQFKKGIKNMLTTKAETINAALLAFLKS
jgi:hypothetical protein